MADIEAYLISLSEKVCPGLWDEGWDSLSPAEQIFACVWQLEAEVNNGGFDQFYSDSAGDHAAETVAALERIGAGHTAAVVRRANALFGIGGPPRDRDTREDALDQVREDREGEFEELDSAFYEYKDNLSQLLYVYVMEHRTEIRGA
jgi:hypothetical protein